MSGYGLKPNDGIPLAIESEALIAEAGPAAIANLFRRGQATPDILSALGLDAPFPNGARP